MTEQLSPITPPPELVNLWMSEDAPSLKEQALALINSNKPYLDDAAMDTIRKALEALPE